MKNKKFLIFATLLTLIIGSIVIIQYARGQSLIAISGNANILFDDKETVLLLNFTDNPNSIKIPERVGIGDLTVDILPVDGNEQCRGMVVIPDNFFSNAFIRVTWTKTLDANQQDEEVKFQLRFNNIGKTTGNDVSVGGIITTQQDTYTSSAFGILTRSFETIDLGVSVAAGDTIYIVLQTITIDGPGVQMVDPGIIKMELVYKGRTASIGTESTGGTPL